MNPKIQRASTDPAKFFKRAMALGGVSFVMAATADAAALAWDDGAVGDSLWSSANNWNPNQLPVLGDSPRLDGGFSSELNSTFAGQFGQVYIGIGGAAATTHNLLVSAGANVDSADGTFVAWDHNATYTQTGGTFISSGGNGFDVSRGNGLTATAAVSGGSLNSQLLRIGSFGTGGSGSMTVSGTGVVTTTGLSVGNSTKVGTLNIAGNGNLAVTGNTVFGAGAAANNSNFQMTGSTAVFSTSGGFIMGDFSLSTFTMNSAGVAAATAAGNFVLGSNAGLTVDASGFSGIGNFNLFTFAAKAGAATFASQNVTGLTGGRTSTIVYNPTNIQVQIVPEPNGMFLASILGGLTLLWRKRA